MCTKETRKDNELSELWFYLLNTDHDGGLSLSEFLNAPDVMTCPFIRVQDQTLNMPLYPDWHYMTHVWQTTLPTGKKCLESYIEA